MCEPGCWCGGVPPSGGSLEIGNTSSPDSLNVGWIIVVPPSGGSLEIGNKNALKLTSTQVERSPFGGIPRNWKPQRDIQFSTPYFSVPPSGGSLEIGNMRATSRIYSQREEVPPSGGSLEIGNPFKRGARPLQLASCSPFGGIPRNWKR